MNPGEKVITHKQVKMYQAVTLKGEEQFHGFLTTTGIVIYEERLHERQGDGKNKNPYVSRTTVISDERPLLRERMKEKLRKHRKYSAICTPFFDTKTISHTTVKDETV